MQETKKIIFKYDHNQNKSLVNGQEINYNDWLLAKGGWDTAQSYNHIKKYVDKYGFTYHDYYNIDNVDIWIFTVIK